MPYKIAADLIVFIHFLWILFLIFGFFLGRKYKTFKVVHITGLCFALIIQIFGWYCPLTYIEIWLREKHNPALSYSGSFIIYYVEKIVYIELSRWIIFILTAILVLISLYFYTGVKHK